MITAAFAYGNVQIVGIAGAETRNPRKAIPAALKRTFFRVIFFYVASILVVSMIVPANDPELLASSGTAAQSPFVIAFNRAGVQVNTSSSLPFHFSNLTTPRFFHPSWMLWYISFLCYSQRSLTLNDFLKILTSAFSSGNSCTFLASRTLHGLALDGNAPNIFLRLNRFGVPYVAVAASAIWGSVAYLSASSGAFKVRARVAGLLYILISSSQAFFWLVSLVTTAGIVSWVIICIVYLRFFYALRKQGISRNRLPYKGPLQPYITVSVSLDCISCNPSFSQIFLDSILLSS